MENQPPRCYLGFQRDLSRNIGQNISWAGMEAPNVIYDCLVA